MDSNDLEENKMIAKAFFVELINEHKYDRIPKIFTEDAEILPRGLRGYAGVEKWLRSFHDIFPDCRDTITGQWAERNQVVTRIRFEGTHKGEWMGFAPSGEHLSWEGVAVHTIRDGKIAKKETVIEQTHVFQKLGWLTP